MPLFYMHVCIFFLKNGILGECVTTRGVFAYQRRETRFFCYFLFFFSFRSLPRRQFCRPRKGQLMSLGWRPVTSLLGFLSRAIRKKDGGKVTRLRESEPDWEIEWFTGSDCNSGTGGGSVNDYFYSSGQDVDGNLTKGGWNSLLSRDSNSSRASGPGAWGVHARAQVKPGLLCAIYAMLSVPNA